MSQQQSGITIPVGIPNYRQLVASDIYIDKSLLIQTIVRSSLRYILVTRPRRFGKTLNLSMLREFFAINTDSKGNAINRESLDIFNGKLVVTQDTVDTNSIAKILNSRNAINGNNKHSIQSLFLYFYLQNYRQFIMNKNDLSHKKLLLDDFCKDVLQLFSFLDCSHLTQKQIQLEVQKQIDEWKNSEHENYELLLLQFGNTCKSYQQYPVISITFPKISDKKIWINGMQEMIKTVFEEHQYMVDVFQNKIDSAESVHQKELLNEEFQSFKNLLFGKEQSLATLTGSIEFLSQILSQHFQRPSIVMIDEYDASLMHAIYEEYFSDLYTFIGILLRKALKDNDYVYGSYITGITRIAKGNEFSDLNHLQEFGILDDGLAEFYGFTGDDMKKIMTEFNNAYDKKIDINIKKVEEWYNGYTIGKTLIYNPWSIANFLKNCSIGNQQFKSYCVDVDSMVIIQNMFNRLPDCDEKNQLLLNKIIKFKPQRLMEIEEIKKFGSIDSFFSYLVHSGYLTKDNTDQIIQNQEASFRIPNKEIKEQFSNHILSKFIMKQLGKQFDIMDMEPIVISLGQLDTFKNKLQEHYLDRLEKGEKMNERDFMSVLYSVIHLNPGYGYYPIQVGQNIFRKKLDSIFFAIHEGQRRQQINGQLKFVTHNNLSEYKVLKGKFQKQKVQELLDNALWQICVLQYFKTIKLFPIQPSESSENIVICRSVVFYQQGQKWKVEVKEFSFTSNQIEYIIEIFSSPDGKNLLDNYQDLVENYSPTTKKHQEQKDNDLQDSQESVVNELKDTLTKRKGIQIQKRNEFLNRYEVSNISQLLTNISKSKNPKQKLLKVNNQNPRQSFSVVNKQMLESTIPKQHIQLKKINNKFSKMPKFLNASSLQAFSSVDLHSNKSLFCLPVYTHFAPPFFNLRNEYKPCTPIFWLVKKLFRK